MRRPNKRAALHSEVEDAVLHPDDGTKLWLQRTAADMHWRVASWVDIDDLIQDGYWLYYRVIGKYSNIKSRAHIMGLFKASFYNHITNLAKKRTRLADAPISVGLDEDPLEALEQLAAENAEYERGIYEVLCEAPPAVRMVLELLLTKPEILRKPYRRRHGTRETTNQRICRALKLPTDIDLVTPTRQYLRGML